MIGAGALAGAAGAGIGGGAQAAIEATYTDKDVEVVGKEQSDKTLGQWAADVGFGTLTGALSGGVGAAANGASRSAAQSVVKDIGPKALVGIATPGVAEQSATIAVTKVIPQVVNNEVQRQLEKPKAAVTKAIDG